MFDGFLNTHLINYHSVLTLNVLLFFRLLFFDFLLKETLMLLTMLVKTIHCKTENYIGVILLIQSITCRNFNSFNFQQFSIFMSDIIEYLQAWSSNEDFVNYK